jgi:hypothetical protein
VLVAHACHPTQEAEIRRIAVQSQPRQIICETLSRKRCSTKKGLMEVVQGVGPKFKSQYYQKKKEHRPKDQNRWWPVHLEGKIPSLYSLCAAQGLT